MKKLTCIIIEDEPEFVEIMKFQLKKVQEIELLGAYGDTVSAALQIERQKPDLIFLDINISGLEGPEFVEMLEHKPKIIIISAHTEGFMKHYPEVYYEDFVQKPTSVERLQEAVAKCL